MTLVGTHRTQVLPPVPADTTRGTANMETIREANSGGTANMETIRETNSGGTFFRLTLVITIYLLGW